MCLNSVTEVEVIRTQSRQFGKPFESCDQELRELDLHDFRVVLKIPVRRKILRRLATPISHRLRYSKGVKTFASLGVPMPPFAFLNDGIDGSTWMLFIVLFVLGVKLVESDGRLQVWGKRCAGGAFFLFIFVQVIEQNPGTAGGWLRIVVRSLIFSGIVLGATWTVLPAAVFTYEHTFGALFRSLDEAAAASRKRADERKRMKEQKLRDEEWERTRPERERQAMEAALQEEARAKLRAAAQKRREDARAACELVYSVVEPEIGKRFSRNDFAQFVAKYMSDNFPPETVEERAEQLKGIIRQHENRSDSPPRERSVQDLATWFEEQKAIIESMPESRERATLLIQLRERYSELTSRLLSELSP